MSKQLEGLLTALLIDHVDKSTTGMCVSSMEGEQIERMFINCNFTSIEYWIDRKLQKIK